jgi:IS605 OrfB family transposase
MGSGCLSLSTVEGRLKVPIHLPKHFLKYADGEVVSLRVREDGGRLYADLVVRLPDTSIPMPTPASTVVGMDRGVVNIAVTSNGQFFNSRALREVRGRYAHLRGRLQTAGTRSAKRHLKRLSGRERRFQRNCNHILSKEIASQDFDVLALEDLSIRKNKKLGRRFNRLLGGWSYGQLESFLQYKCEEQGKNVILVNPAYTSQDCSRCGVRGKRKGSTFKCLFCGFSLNADLNAARNIADRGMSLVCRPGVNGPIVAGMKHRAEPCVDHSYKPPVLTGGS